MQIMHKYAWRPAFAPVVQTSARRREPSVMRTDVHLFDSGTQKPNTPGGQLTRGKDDLPPPRFDSIDLVDVHFVRIAGMWHLDVGSQALPFVAPRVHAKNETTEQDRFAVSDSPDGLPVACRESMA